MAKQDLIDVLNKTSEIEKLLTSTDSSYIPNIKTINEKVEFKIWKAKLKQQLRKLKQEPLIVETLQLLDNGFKNGFTDERDFNDLKANLAVIAPNLDEYVETIETERQAIRESGMRLKKGALVQTAFDEYTLIEQVGSGGNGRVFSSENTEGESFAIKFIERNIGGDKLKRFKNEINFCEQHHHKNIVPIIDRGYAYLDGKDYVFYVMPLYKETLKAKIKAGVSPEDAVDIFIGILEGLKYAHEHDAIHRDIKPENILFAEDSTDPVICDFGIAHFAEEDLLTAIETRPGDRMANFYYAAPEQYKRGVAACPQTDIYAAALILNEMFTGEIPQAAGYTTIKDINEDYGYLDDLFVQLYVQAPEQRLYPEDRILSEMKLLAEKHKRGIEKARLQSIVDEMVDPGVFEASIVKKEYRAGNLIFVFDRALPDDWYQFIAYGSYSCSFMMGYGHEKLKKINKNELAMPLRGGERESDLKSIVDNVGNWVRTANLTYSRDQQQKAIAEQQRKEAERQAEIERIEKEDALATMIANL